MSLADTLIRLAAPAHILVHNDVWRIESGPLAGTEFSASANSETVMALDTDLGTDAREKTSLYLERPIPVIVRGMFISGKGCTWRIVGDLDDNPLNDCVKVEIVKIASGKDT